MTAKIVLLTGATGFIGNRLIQHLQAYGHVCAVARQPPEKASAEVSWLRADLGSCDSSWLPPSVETIVYAAQSRLYRDVLAGANDLFAINVAGLKTVIDAALSRGLRRVVYLSSANVYARSTESISESDPIAPESYYAHTKRMAELLLEAYGSAVECCVLRVFTVYGGGQRGMLVARLLGSVERGEPLRLDPAGDLLLSPVYVDDVCTAVRRILDSPPKPGWRVFNVGGPEMLSIEGLATVVGTLFGRSPVFEKASPATALPVGWAASTEKMRLELGWAPQTTVEEGLVLTLAATRRQPSEAGGA